MAEAKIYHIVFFYVLSRKIDDSDPRNTMTESFQHIKIEFKLSDKKLNQNNRWLVYEINRYVCKSIMIIYVHMILNYIYYQICCGKSLISIPVKSTKEINILLWTGGCEISESYVQYYSIISRLLRHGHYFWELQKIMLG